MRILEPKSTVVRTRYMDSRLTVPVGLQQIVLAPSHTLCSMLLTTYTYMAQRSSYKADKKEMGMCMA